MDRDRFSMAQPNSYWQRFKSSIQGVDHAWQLALGVTLGMMIGLMAKESLLFVVLVVLTILSPANLLTAAISALVCSLVASCEPVMSAMHSLGYAVLSQSGIQTTVGPLLAKPLMPWFRLDNSMVMGGLVLGVMLALPVYMMSLVFFNRLGLRVYHKIRDSSYCRWLMGSPTSKTSEGAI